MLHVSISLWGFCVLQARAVGFRHFKKSVKQIAVILDALDAGMSGPCENESTLIRDRWKITQSAKYRITSHTVDTKQECTNKQYKNHLAPCHLRPMLVLLSTVYGRKRSWGLTLMWIPSFRAPCIQANRCWKSWEARWSLRKSQFQVPLAPCKFLLMYMVSTSSTVRVHKALLQS